MADTKRNGGAATSSRLRKDALMAQNLRLLGLEAAPSASAETMAATTTSPEAQVAPNMFDRPNEKLLFRTLHFLLLRLRPAVAQELRYCWPIATPQDKTTFKKLVQALLLELEKQQQLPPGSSQASRINTGCGPRVVDLVWRLSNLAVRTALERDFAPKKFAPLPPFARASTADALLAVRTKIAVKTQALKATSVARCRVQDAWVAFAATLADEIHALSAAQKHVQEAQNALDAASGDRSAFSHAAESRRATNLQNLEAAWRVIDDALASPAYAKIQSVLRTAVQYDAAQPVLAADAIRPSVRGGLLGLSDVLMSTDALLDTVRSRVRIGALEPLDENLAASVLETSRRHVASLRTMVLQLQQAVARIKDANERDARDRYIRMAASEAGGGRESRTPTRQLTLCPLTPAQESRLVQSLTKVSMTELTTLAAASVRRSTQRKQRGLRPTEEATAATAAATASDQDDMARELSYSDGDDAMEEEEP